ncbi:hypothetical protein KUF83_30085 [Streptomyces sp. BV286]|uniref:hypothetical protein n=1 Tax=Streptomyces sp. BV286 TaxID=2849672 RepID=UPI001C2E0E51|nr:hypothetical protein [Streptomyces sp. BV286]MBV1940786.1 hypothetical protein [Streptomyces sp. BV286]
MPEKDNAPDDAVNASDLALRAAVAYRVQSRVAKICEPVIEANAAHIRSAKGTRSTAAELPLPEGGTMPLGTFTRQIKKPKFVIDDPKALLDYADEQGETEYVIRPAFQTALLARLVFRNGKVIDSVTGEIVEGISYDPGGLSNTVSPSWSTAGTDALDDRLGFVDASLENLPRLTAATFSLPMLEAGE